MRSYAAYLLPSAAHRHPREILHLQSTTAEKLCRALARIGTSGSFATNASVPASDLRLSVAGVGRIRLPISAASARKLCAVASLARHGFKEETRLDTRVRDTWEISKRKLVIDDTAWQNTLAPQLERIRSELGLPQGKQLKAQLHNLLIYAPGQFFVTHQDSEKADHMMGTLVVTLPSRFTGGEMVIEHHDEKLISRGSATRLGFTAFYADCRHEVRPIKSGYRVVLTYNLIASGTAAAATAQEDKSSALQRCVREFFTTPLPPRWSTDSTHELPNRLVYLLDHEYTQRALRWDTLKGADAARAQALQEIARQLDCEIRLALADVHEIWDCVGQHAYYCRGSYWSDDQADAAGLPADLTLGDLIDGEVELRHWVGEKQKSAAFSPRVDDGELIYTLPNSALEPFESDYEGYTGNAGNTLDRWYHRAAVVLWPRDREFVMRAKASASWALNQVSKALKAKDPQKARALVAQLLPFWKHAVGRDPAPELLGTTLTVAVQLDDAKTAAELLEPFSLWMTTPGMTAQLVRLFELCGPGLSQRVLQQWTATRNFTASEARWPWVARTLTKLCINLCHGGSAARRELAGWLVRYLWVELDTSLKGSLRVSNPTQQQRELQKLARPMLALLTASQASLQSMLADQIIAVLLATNTPLSLALGVLKAANAAGADQHHALQPVHARCLQEISQRLQVPARSKDDWSIAVAPCSCRVCLELNRYLQAREQIFLEWPLAEVKRTHVQGMIEQAELPVVCTVRRKGNPFSLVLQKTAALFTREAAARQLWEEQLHWLATVAAEFRDA